MHYSAGKKKKESARGKRTGRSAISQTSLRKPSKAPSTEPHHAKAFPGRRKDKPPLKCQKKSALTRLIDGLLPPSFSYSTGVHADCVFVRNLLCSGCAWSLAFCFTRPPFPLLLFDLSRAPDFRRRVLHVASETARPARRQVVRGGPSLARPTRPPLPRRTQLRAFRGFSPAADACTISAARSSLNYVHAWHVHPLAFHRNLLGGRTTGGTHKPSSRPVYPPPSPPFPFRTAHEASL